MGASMPNARLCGCVPPGSETSERGIVWDTRTATHCPGCIANGKATPVPAPEPTPVPLPVIEELATVPEHSHRHIAPWVVAALGFIVYLLAFTTILSVIGNWS